MNKLPFPVNCYNCDELTTPRTPGHQYFLCKECFCSRCCTAMNWAYCQICEKKVACCMCDLHFNLCVDCFISCARDLCDARGMKPYAGCTNKICRKHEIDLCTKCLNTAHTCGSGNTMKHLTMNDKVICELCELCEICEKNILHGKLCLCTKHIKCIACHSSKYGKTCSRVILNLHAICTAYTIMRIRAIPKPIIFIIITFAF